MQPGALIVHAAIERSFQPLRPLRTYRGNHLEVVVWQPPDGPAAYGMYVRRRGVTPWALSIVRPQRALVTRRRGFPTATGRWRAWLVDRAALAAATGWLEGAVAAARAGTWRYSVGESSCVHLVAGALEAAGIDGPTIRHRRLLGLRIADPADYAADLLGAAAARPLDAAALAEALATAARPPASRSSAPGGPPGTGRRARPRR